MKAPLHPSTLLTLSLLLFGLITVQTGKITGITLDMSGNKLKSVEVHNLSNHFVNYSDEHGAFKINGKPGDTLRFKPMGLPVFDTIISNQDDVKITLGRPSKTINPKPAFITARYLAPTKSTTSKTVSGVVSDESGPLPGANVIIKGTSYGTSTDIDGRYAIEAEFGSMLVFNFVGMTEQVIKVDREIINVKLTSDGIELSEVVVEGYSVKRAKKSMAAMSIRGVSSVSDAAPAKTKKALAGKVAGLKITTPSDSETFKPGQLTAGEVNDFSKWDYWEDIAKPQLSQWQALWKMAPETRFSVILKHADGFAVQDKTVHLLAGKDTLWSARTGNTGRAELWFKPETTASKIIPDNLAIVDENGVQIAASPKEFRDGVNAYTYSDLCKTPNKVNIAFMVDATGSMGDEIEYLQSELSDVISRTKTALPDAELSMASVFYRDKGDDYLVKNFDFTENIPDVISFMQRQSAGGGGDYPEAAVEAFGAAIDDLHWEDDARTRLLFVLLDAPPHESDANFAKLQAMSRRASLKGIRIIPVAASGIDKSTEYLMRAMALQTNGTYLFITNHSGIGNDHIEPSTDSYTVEMLNDLLLRIIVQFTATGDCNAQILPTNTKMDAALNTKNSIKWSYYPNPTSGIVTVECGKKATGYSVFDTTGKLVLYKKESGEKFTLDLSAFPNAVYYLNVYVADKTLMGKIIKQM